MFWDFFTIVLIFATLFVGREVQIVLAKVRLSNWRNFTFR